MAEGVFRWVWRRKETIAVAQHLLHELVQVLPGVQVFCQVPQVFSAPLEREHASVVISAEVGPLSCMYPLLEHDFTR